jgi:hypothetical protein
MIDTTPAPAAIATGVMPTPAGFDTTSSATSLPKRPFARAVSVTTLAATPAVTGRSFAALSTASFSAAAMSFCTAPTATVDRTVRPAIRITMSPAAVAGPVIVKVPVAATPPAFSSMPMPHTWGTAPSLRPVSSAFRSISVSSSPVPK